MTLRRLPRFSASIAVLFVALFFLLPVAVSEATPSRGQAGLPIYTVNELRSPYVQARPLGISLNDIGNVVGAVFTESVATELDPARGMLWEGGTITPLAVLSDTTYAVALDINEQEYIVGVQGYYTNADGYAVVWNGDTMRDLGAVAGGSARANAINDWNQIVGASTISDNPIQYAAVWDNGARCSLGALNPGQWSVAHDINNRGQIVGESFVPALARGQAFLWENGTMRELGSLGSNQRRTTAFAINDAGQVVGAYLDADWKFHAFHWENGVMQNLYTPYAGQSEAKDINNRGQVVGSVGGGSRPYTVQYAALWQDGVLFDLNDYVEDGVFLQSAYAVNEHGQIVAVGSRIGNSPFIGSFLLTPQRLNDVAPEVSFMTLSAQGPLGKELPLSLYLPLTIRSPLVDICP